MQYYNYEKQNYNGGGNDGNYYIESIVINECTSCMEPAKDDGNNNNQNNYNNYNNGDDNYNYNKNGNNNNQNQEDAAVLEVCERLYEEAGKCESNLNVYGVYPTTFACKFI